MKKSVAIIGLGLFGEALAIELSNLGAEVLAIDLHEEKLKRVSDYVKEAIMADARDDVAMSKLGFDSIDSAVVCIGENLESTIMSIMKLKENGVKKIWVKASTQEQCKIYEALGATYAFIPEKMQAISFARSFVTDNFYEFYELSDKISLIKLKVRDEWVGQTLATLNLRKKLGINIVAVEKNKNIQIDIDPTAKISADDTFYVVADKKATNRLER